MKTKEAEECLESIGGRLDRDPSGMPRRFKIEHGTLGLVEAHAIRDLPDITYIELGGCRISDTFLDEISLNERLGHLEMRKCGLDDNSLKRVSRSNSVTCLWVDENNAITDAGVAVVSKMKKLSSISFSGCRHVTDACFESLSQLPLLKTLMLDGCPLVTGSGLTVLTPLRHLRELGLNSSGLTNENASLLARFPDLTSLSINFTKIGDSGARDVMNGCRLLTSAGLQSTKVTDKCFDDLREDLVIDTVDVFYTQVTCAGLAKLHVLKNLREIYFDGQVNSVAEAESLKVLVNLAYLNLGDEISEKSRAYLKKGLPGVDVYP